jgi:hypothetical protein
MQASRHAWVLEAPHACTQVGKAYGRAEHNSTGITGQDNSMRHVWNYLR